MGVTGSSVKAKRLSRRSSRHFAVHQAVRLEPELHCDVPMTREAYLTPDPSLRKPLPCQASRSRTLESFTSRKITLHSAFSVHGFDFFDGRKVWYEAELELNFGLVAKLNTNVASIAEQPNAIYYYDEDGVIHRHTFDFLVTMTDGRKCLVAVKPSHYVPQTGIDRVVKLAAQQIPRSVADMVLLFTEESLSPIDLSNAKTVHFARKSHFPEDGAHLDEVTRDLIDVTSIREIVQTSGLRGYGFDAVVRALANRTLRLAQYERITLDTSVFRPSALPEASH